MLNRLNRALAAIVIALQCVACGSTSVTQLTGPDPVRCQTSLGSTPTLPAAGGRVDVGVVAARECTWNAASEAAWLQVSPTSGQGEASITLTAPANPQALVRTGTIVIGGQRIGISQAASPCRFDLDPSAADVPAGGGSTTLHVGTLAGCSWTAASNISWITVSQGGSGSGPADVVLSVQANGSTAARSAGVTVAGLMFSIFQAGSTPSPTPSPAPAPAPGPAPVPTPSPDPTSPCSYAIDPLVKSFKNKGGGGSVQVSTGSACSWTAASDVSWVVITDHASGTGPGDVKYKVDDNRTPFSRTGTVTVAGLTHLIFQQGD